jgi:hypothetical protein
MPRFFNRQPWNAIAGLGGIVVVLFVAAALTTWWVMVTPLALVALIYGVQWVARVYALVTRGYYARQGFGAKLLYEEVHQLRLRALSLKLEHTEPGHYELFVPPEQDWLRLVPDWAKGRRSEIAERIAESWKRQDVHVGDRALGV